MRFEPGEDFARGMDESDPLKSFRAKFHIPAGKNGKEVVYLCGNSLGLQPKSTQSYLEQELTDWAKLGVRGHFAAKNPWFPYHEFLTEQMARLVGAKTEEVVVMNSLTVNLHLMLASFYQPKPERFKILMEANAFPSDQYAVTSQVRFHGYDPAQAIEELKPRTGEMTLRPEDIFAAIERLGSSLSLVLLGNVNYLTGQAFDMAAITRLAHGKGAKVGFDLAHGVGNLTLNLHEDAADFAVWCSYKYLNAGPGGIAGVFVHERHAKDLDLPRFCGWWGHTKKTRFEMKSTFDPIPGAEGWQLSNPPIFQLAALRASLEIFDEAGREQLKAKRDLLTGYLEYLLQDFSEDFLQIVTPADPLQRGSQLSLRVTQRAQAIAKQLEEEGFIADFREPNILRVAPVPLYCRFQESFEFVRALKRISAL